MDARYKKMHAKVAIFDDRAAYVGSANLTGSGLRRNIEAGCVVVEDNEVTFFTQRFDDYFDQAKHLLDQVLPPLEESWSLAEPAAPYLLYLRALFEVFGDVPAPSHQGRFKLAAYQKMIVGSALSDLLRHRGAMLISPTGTGKTVMGAYIASVMLAKECRRVVVLPPNEAVADKWLHTMRAFHVTPEILTHGRVQGKGKRSERTARHLQEVLGDLAPTDLLIVDESHAFRNDETNGFEGLISYLGGAGPERPFILLLTATPVSAVPEEINRQAVLAGLGCRIGSINDVSTAEGIVNVSLPFIVQRFGVTTKEGDRALEFGDERRFFPSVSGRTKEYETHLDAVFEAISGMELAMGVPDEELGLFDDVPMLKNRGGTGFLRVVLWRLAESSVAALVAGLERMRSRIAAGECTPLRRERFFEGLDALDELIAEAGDDAKLDELLKLLPEERHEKTLIFICHRDTAEYLAQAIGRHLPELRVEVLTGETSRPDRDNLVKRFAPVANGRSRRRRNTDIDVLVATDTLSEGLDLQDARTVINYDLHWTPMRLIQRMGRVNRPTTEPRHVWVWNFYPGTEVFERLVGLHGRLGTRSEYYRDLAGTVVTGDYDRTLRDIEEADVGAVRAIYEGQDYESFLDRLPQTTSQVMQLGCASAADLADARSLPVGARSCRVGDRPGLFLLLKVDDLDSPHCAFFPAVGEPDFAPWVRGFDLVLGYIECEPGQAGLALPADYDERLLGALDAWCAAHEVEAERVTITCSMVVSPPTPGTAA